MTSLGTDTRTHTTDVLVVGAGPTGLLLACELALAGVRTVVAERRDAPHRESRALNLHPRGIELMDMRGLAGRFLSRGRTVPGWQFAATLPRRLDFTALDTRHPYALLLAQARTEALLEERARELGVRVRRGHRAVALRQSATGAEVELRGPGDTVTVRAGYVAGCDGGRGFVREAAGIGFPGTRESMTAVVGDFAVADHSHNERARRHGVLVARLEDGLTRFVVMDPLRVRVPSTEPVTLAEFRASLLRVCGTDCGVGEPRWLSRFGNATRLAESYRRGRVLLAGDAAHIHFPVGAQGLNTGLQDAMNLGWKLAAAVRGWAPPGLLDTYHAERRPVGRAVTDGTRAQTLLVELPLTEEYGRPAALLCELLDTLLGMPEVNRHLAGRISALDTVYPPAAPDADPLTGHRMPDIGLTTPAAARPTRVYELLRDGRFVLLRLGLDGGTERAVADSRVRAVTVRSHDGHRDLDGVREVLVRPDGHVAWATHATDPDVLRAERSRALAAWAGPGTGSADQSSTP
ncbi:FAD-dependent monooxygenase [Streptomyces hesseae]|uniref:FAD-dependent monooxygenase n=1 Tax=Streptomyces hesseae TaxID=3075519 RepID=A0ABU2SEX5_9ACTN|nr:FAD-dependent monooxygenase [Streptomyces sp. DSM 40473]MDT0447493.1 FAD-dependent monooxygenase [Streptomyces sp. DSM 40473]